MCNDAVVIDAFFLDSNAFISLNLIIRSIWCPVLTIGCWYLGNCFSVDILQVVLLGTEGVSLQGTKHLLRSTHTIVCPQLS